MTLGELFTMLFGNGGIIYILWDIFKLAFFTFAIFIGGSLIGAAIYTLLEGLWHD